MPQPFEFDPTVFTGFNPNSEPLPTQPKVLIFGGATEGVDTLSGLTEALQAEGMAVHSFDYTTTPAPERSGDFGQKRYQEARLLEALEEIDKFTEDGKKITLFGHSVGAPVAVEAALLRPDKVERVILSNASGLFDDSMPRLTGRFAAETVLRKNLTLNKHGRKQTWNGTKKIASGAIAFLGEALDSARTNSMLRIAALRGHGVKVDVITSRADMVYPSKRVVKSAYESGAETEAVTVDSLAFDSLSFYFGTKQKRNGKARVHRLAGKYAGHDHPIVYPEYAAKVVSQLVRQ